MKSSSPKVPLLAEELRASPKKNRREHAPKPNFATWLVIAWIVYMAAWGCKHLYRQWTEDSTYTSAVRPVETVFNATASTSAGACPLK